jgi:hypothetical protein
MTIATSGNYYGAGSGVDGYVAKFIPEIWSGKLQAKFYDSTVLSAIANTDWEGEIKDQGDKVKIRTVPNITIRDYAKGQSLTTEVPVTSVVELDINKGKYFAVVADDVDKIQADLRLMDLFSNDAAQQMKIAVDTDVLAGLVNTAIAANKGFGAGKIDGSIPLGDGFHATVGSRRSVAIDPTVSAGSGSTSTRRTPLDYLIDMGQVMDEQNLPESGRFVVVPAWFAAMFKKGDLKNAQVAGDSVSMARNGKIGEIDRFTVYVSNLLPFQTAIADSNSGTGKKAFHVFAGVKEGLTFASQVTKVERLRSTQTFGDIMRGLNVYGYKVVTPTALVEGFVSR